MDVKPGETRAVQATEPRMRSCGPGSREVVVAGATGLPAVGRGREHNRAGVSRLSVYHHFDRMGPACEIALAAENRPLHPPPRPASRCRKTSRPDPPGLRALGREITALLPPLHRPLISRLCRTLPPLSHGSRRRPAIRPVYCVAQGSRVCDRPRQPRLYRLRPAFHLAVAAGLSPSVVETLVRIARDLSSRERSSQRSD